MIITYRILFISLLFLVLAHTGLAFQVANQVVEIRVASIDSPSENNSNFHYLANLPPGQPVTFAELDYLIVRIADFMVVTSVILAVIYIIWGGITYMAAGADTSKVAEAQTRIKNGIIGTAVVLGVGVIINTIAGIVSRDFFCQFQVIGVCIIP